MEHRRSTPAFFILGICIALGLVGAAFFLKEGLLIISASQRFVTVKGLAEREVNANLVVWPIRYVTTGDALADVQTSAEQDTQKIENFLLNQGFKKEEMERSVPVITDRQAQAYGDVRPDQQRYIVESVLTLRSNQVAKVKESLAKSTELVKQGVALTMGASVEYFFTDLNSIKPEMIAAATKDARNAAEKFASDSGAKVGGIRNASQGYFSIEPRDMYAQDVKNIRVVTTIDYYLVD